MPNLIPRCLLVIGIGGSASLGARAAIEFLRHGFYNSVSKEIRKTPEIYYCGNSLEWNISLTAYRSNRGQRFLCKYNQ